MTKNELIDFCVLVGLNTHLSASELFFDEIPLIKFSDEVRNEVAAYKEHTERLNEKIRTLIAAKFAYMTEEK